MASDNHLRTVLLSVATGTALVALAAPALAFQEQSVGADAGKAAAAAPALQMPKLDLSSPDLAGGKGSGIDVRIPGVGSLGTLPKLDFGLELLYGANESGSVRPDDRSQPSDVQIRATIKHRF